MKIAGVNPNDLQKGVQLVIEQKAGKADHFFRAYLLKDGNSVELSGIVAMTIRGSVSEAPTAEIECAIGRLNWKGDIIFRVVE